MSSPPVGSLRLDQWKALCRALSTDAIERLIADRIERDEILRREVALSEREITSLREEVAALEAILHEDDL